MRLNPLAEPFRQKHSKRNRKIKGRNKNFKRTRKLTTRSCGMGACRAHGLEASGTPYSVHLSLAPGLPGFLYFLRVCVGVCASFISYYVCYLVMFLVFAVSSVHAVSFPNLGIPAYIVRNEITTIATCRRKKWWVPHRGFSASGSGQFVTAEEGYTSLSFDRVFPASARFFHYGWANAIELGSKRVRPPVFLSLSFFFLPRFSER